MNRLEAIASLVKKCDVVADIGTDHGYVAELLLKNDICKKVIASDINKGPLSSAINHLTGQNLDDRVDFRLGSGMTVLNKNEANTVVIAGMGGDLICSILDTSIDLVNTTDVLILQPMTAIDRLREHLYEIGFKIVEEKIVKEYHHYYFIIKAVKGTERIDDNIYFEISKYLLDKKDKLLLEYITKKIDTNNKIINNLDNACEVENKERAEFFKQKNHKLMELIKNYDSI